MFMLVSWFGLTLPLLNAADWFRCIRLLKRLFVSSHLSEVIYVWCYCWRYCFCSCWWRDRKSGSAGMPRPISYAVFCLKKKIFIEDDIFVVTFSFFTPLVFITSIFTAF